VSDVLRANSLVQLELMRDTKHARPVDQNAGWQLMFHACLHYEKSQASGMHGHVCKLSSIQLFSADLQDGHAQEQIDKSGTHSRYIPWNHTEEGAVHQTFESNAVSTAKYDQYFVTFIPLFLFEMFSRVAYLYFLIQVCA
jgi:hypothetical protein